MKRRTVLTSGLSVAAAMSLGQSGAAAKADSPAQADCWSSAALAASHREPAATGVGTGGCRMVQLHNGYNVWVKHVAAYNSSIPVLTLHGGPGFPHFYFECFEDFLPQAGMTYWYYDQLGCGFSDQPDDTRLWNLARFTSEVEEVRTALGFERMVVLGHSWGGMLAIEYALAHPDRLAGLVISNMVASIPSYEKYILKLRDQLPAAKLDRLKELERTRAYDTPEYEDIINYLYHQHICRVDPWPEPVSRAVKWLALPVYNTVQGKSEFEVTGNMKGWDRWQDLPKIRTPTLILGGRYDTMSPQDLMEMSRRMPAARTVICPNGSHLSMYDDQQSYFSVLLPFLNRVTRRA
ncbi:MAG: proline iminopeptidase-family hydrolase [Steroidobacteraceae bacterium]